MGGFFKVLGFLVGSSAAGGSVYYWSRDEGEKRRVRVQLGGVTRFLRCIFCFLSVCAPVLMLLCRSAVVGVSISCDYWWTMRNLDEVQGTSFY